MDTKIKQKYIVKLIHSLLRLGSKTAMINTPTIIQYVKNKVLT